MSKSIGNKFIIFSMSLLLLFGFIVLALFASLVFSIKHATAPTQIAGSNNIAVIEVNGIIMSSGKILEKIMELKKEQNIRAIIIRIDSPGGAVGPAQEIYSEILKLRNKIPVYASMATIATSGGYYIAAACEKIYSNPGTLTGSIGVIMNFINLKEIYKYFKLNRFSIKSGKFKDIGSENRDMTNEEKVLVNNLIQNTFKQFTDAIVKTRKLSKKNLQIISDGRIMTGLQAKELGLVDEIGTLNDAIDAIAIKLNIEDPEIIYPLRKKEKFLQLLLNSSLSQFFDKWINRIENSLLYYLPQNIVEVRYENN